MLVKEEFFGDSSIKRLGTSTLKAPLPELFELSPPADMDNSDEKTPKFNSFLPEGFHCQKSS